MPAGRLAGCIDPAGWALGRTRHHASMSVYHMLRAGGARADARCTKTLGKAITVHMAGAINSADRGEPTSGHHHPPGFISAR